LAALRDALAPRADFGMSQLEAAIDRAADASGVECILIDHEA